MNEDNLLPPGTSRTIQIQFFAPAARKFEETISFIISDTCPAEAQGVPLRLVGTGAMPTLDLWNLETTFREHLIVKNLCEYKVPEVILISSSYRFAEVLRVTTVRISLSTVLTTLCVCGELCDVTFLLRYGQFESHGCNRSVQQWPCCLCAQHEAPPPK